MKSSRSSMSRVSTSLVTILVLIVASTIKSHCAVPKPNLSAYDYWTSQREVVMKKGFFLWNWGRGICFPLVLVMLMASLASGIYRKDPLYNGVIQNDVGGWSYVYYSSTDLEYWRNGSAWRFAYAYGTGQWFDYDRTNTWRKLGESSASAVPLWDGAAHNLNNGWSYSYTASSDLGYCRTGLTGVSHMVMVTVSGSIMIDPIRGVTLAVRVSLQYLCGTGLLTT